MTNFSPNSSIGYTSLKARQRAERGEFPDNLGLRVHRAISWLERAENETDDLDARFLFYWIAFNAAYADDCSNAGRTTERSVFQSFFTTIVELDKEEAVYDQIWHHFPQSIRILLQNKFVFQPFWDFHHGVAEKTDWERRFDTQSKLVAKALGTQNTVVVLSILFDRLYTLRNQLVHGGATWNSSVNRDQVSDGSKILSILVPLFISIMMDFPRVEWDDPHYPVVGG